MDDTTSAESAQDAAQLRATLARLESLTELSFALSGAVSTREVAQVVVEQGVRHAGANIATLYVLDESGEALDLLAERGVAPEVLQKIGRISKSVGNPRVLETLATGVSVWVETEREYDAIFPELARLPATGRRAKAFWSVPLVVEGRPVGLLGMGFFEEQRFSIADRRFVETFAKLCAQALLRAVRRDRELVAWRWLATTLQSIGDAVIATDHVFEPFRQADSSTTRRHGGLGLGLSLVRQIASAHGGTVEASSAGLGRGATFVVRLPARAASEAVRPSRPASKPTAFASGAGALLAGVRILVVDDELDARELVAEAFKTAGAIVYTAASAPDALSLLAVAQPDVLVSDIGMPHEDGYALMRQIRLLPAERGGEIPALALTAYARATDAERAFDAGYQRHVAKPVDPLLLVQLVAGLAGRSTPVPRS